MSKQKKVGVILAGCGYLDGAEIQEAVLTLLYLDKAGAEVVCMAPDIPQAHVINHLTGKESGETRNVLVESARIVRGNIKNIESVDPDSLDALILPGGFGVAKNLCNFAFKGAGMSIHPSVENMAKAVHAAGKPIGAWCISPSIMAKLFPGVTLTIGNEKDTAGALEIMGAKHCECAVEDFIVDRKKKIVTTPAYMLGPWIADIAAGIERGVREVLDMA